MKGLFTRATWCTLKIFKHQNKVMKIIRVLGIVCWMAINDPQFSKAQRQNSEENIVHPHLYDNHEPLWIVQTAESIQAFIQRANTSCHKNNNRFKTTKKKCLRITNTPFDEMMLYAAEPNNASYTVTIPEGRLNLAPLMTGYGVAAVDPFPEASFGHVVLVFYVYKMTRHQCKSENGFVSSRGSGVCLFPAFRKDCKRKRKNSNKNNQNCEVNFLPLVHTGSEGATGQTQFLRCERAGSFDNCPRDLDEEANDDCENVTHLSNCTHRRTSTKMPVCQLVSTCDYAVAIFGGWNQLTDKAIYLQQQDNMETMKKMFSRTGFEENKIQIFYHEKFKMLGPGGSTYRHGLPANDKSAVRNHILSLCRSSFQCADSFVIYLNGPTTSNGSILLWDNNGNGKPDGNEVYQVEEFLDDIAHCQARHVFVFADQSYSRILMSNFRDRFIRAASPSEWNHTVLATWGGSSEYSWRKWPTEEWGTLKPEQPVSSVLSVPRKSTFYNKRAERFTLYGAEITNDVETRASTRNSMGCENMTIHTRLVASARRRK